jgi:hypothetical protein
MYPEFGNTRHGPGYGGRYIVEFEIQENPGVSE